MCAVRLPLPAQQWWRSTPRHFHVHKQTAPRVEEDGEDVSVGTSKRCQIALSYVLHVCRALVAGACVVFRRLQMCTLMSSLLLCCCPNMLCFTCLLPGSKGD